MLRYEEARKIAVVEMNRNWYKEEDPLVIVDTVEKEYAWIFCYNSKAYIETENVLYALGGDAPIFVSKYDGRVDCYRTGLSLEEMIDEHEEDYQLWSLVRTGNVSYETKQVQALKHAMQWSMKEITTYKKSADACITKGSQSRLLHLQKLLAEHAIATDVQLNKGAH